MTTRSRGPGAAFGWLSRGISVGFDEPKLLFVGAALVAMAALLPTLITLPMQFYALHAGTPLQSSVFRWIAILSTLFGLLAVPLYAGYLQVVDAVEHGLLPTVGDIIKPYREGKASRLIGYGFLMLVIYLAMFVTVTFNVCNFNALCGGVDGRMAGTLPNLNRTSVRHGAAPRTDV